MIAGALVLYNYGSTYSEHDFKVQVYLLFIQILTWLCDDPLPDIKTRVVIDGGTDGYTDGHAK